MHPMATSRPRRVTTLIAVLGLGAVGFVPLFDGPGYEAAVAAGVLLPSLAACATALDVLRERRLPLAAFYRGCSTGTWLGVVGLVLSFLHGWRTGFCDPLEGAQFFVLGPGVGAVMGGVWGALVGLFAARFEKRARPFAIGLALAGPIAGIALSVWRFYTSPMVFAFDPFFGFFAGTLYDSVITGLDRLVTYRAGSLATLVAAGARRRPSSSARRRVSFGSRASASGRRSCSASPRRSRASCTSCVGRRSATIRRRRRSGKRSGQHVSFGRCELVYPTGTPDLEARALVRECDGHLAQLDRFFGTRGPAHVVAFVFASPEQKGYLMGAVTTYIAKPWRREIYIQRSGFPHPVMRHELAHVVAGTFGTGPFRVAGPLHGLIPDPGRIEGVAVAAAPHDEELSLDEWAKAMRDLSLLPPLARVFKLSFLGEPSSRAYVVAGAFIDWLRRAKGIEVVRRWYAGASLEAATGGQPLEQLEHDWLASLDRLHVGEDVLHVARARFDQPAIFGRHCPHVVDRIAGEAGGALGQMDTERAARLYDDLLALDPHDVGARLGLATCALRDGKNDAARALYERIAADAALGKTVRARALESLGDLALASGDGQAARQRFDEVATAVVDADRPPDPRRQRSTPSTRRGATRSWRTSSAIFEPAAIRRSRPRRSGPGPHGSRISACRIICWLGFISARGAGSS